MKKRNFLALVLALSLFLVVTPVTAESYSLNYQQHGLLYENQFSDSKSYTKYVTSEPAGNIYVFEKNGWLNISTVDTTFRLIDAYIKSYDYDSSIVEVKLKVDGNVAPTGAKIRLFSSQISSNKTDYDSSIYHIQFFIEYYNSTHIYFKIEHGKSGAYECLTNTLINYTEKTIRIFPEYIKLIENNISKNIEINCSYIYFTGYVNSGNYALFDYIKIYKNTKTITFLNLKDYVLEVNGVNYTVANNVFEYNLSDYYQTITVKIYKNNVKLLEKQILAYGGDVYYFSASSSIIDLTAVTQILVVVLVFGLISDLMRKKKIGALIIFIIALTPFIFINNIAAPPSLFEDFNSLNSDVWYISGATVENGELILDKGDYVVSKTFFPLDNDTTYIIEAKARIIDVVSGEHSGIFLFLVNQTDVDNNYVHCLKIEMPEQREDNKIYVSMQEAVGWDKQAGVTSLTYYYNKTISDTQAVVKIYINSTHWTAIFNNIGAKTATHNFKGFYIALRGGDRSLVTTSKGAFDYVYVYSTHEKVPAGQHIISVACSYPKENRIYIFENNIVKCIGNGYAKLLVSHGSAVTIIVNASPTTDDNGETIYYKQWETRFIAYSDKHFDVKLVPLGKNDTVKITVTTTPSDAKIDLYYQNPNKVGVAFAYDVHKTAYGSLECNVPYGSNVEIIVSKSGYKTWTTSFVAIYDRTFNVVLQSESEGSNELTDKGIKVGKDYYGWKVTVLDKDKNPVDKASVEIIYQCSVEYYKALFGVFGLMTPTSFTVGTATTDSNGIAYIVKNGTIPHKADPFGQNKYMVKVRTSEGTFSTITMGEQNKIVDVIVYATYEYVYNDLGAMFQKWAAGSTGTVFGNIMAIMPLIVVILVFGLIMRLIESTTRRR